MRCACRNVPCKESPEDDLEPVDLAVSPMLITSAACFGCLDSGAYRRRIKEEGKEEVKEEDKEEVKEEVKELEGSKALELLVERIIDQRQRERDEGEVPDVQYFGVEQGPTEELNFWRTIIFASLKNEGS